MKIVVKIVCRITNKTEMSLTRRMEIENDVVERDMVLLREILRVEQRSLGDKGNRVSKLQLASGEDKMEKKTGIIKAHANQGGQRSIFFHTGITGIYLRPKILFRTDKFLSKTTIVRK